MQTLTQVKIPEKNLSTTDPSVPSSNDHPTLSDVVEKVQISVEQPISSTPSKFSSDAKQLNSSGLTAAALQQSPEAAQADRPATSENTSIVTYTVGVQHNDKISVSVRGQSIKIEEPLIKREDIPSSGIIDNDNTTIAREASIPAKENQAASDEVVITDCTEEKGVTSNYDQVTANENHEVHRDIPIATGEEHIAINNPNNASPEETGDTIEEEQATPPRAELFAAYKGLFRTYYGETPSIDTKDIGVALRQVEAIIRVAELYGSIPAVRPYLANCLMQFGRVVYQATLQDPPRWLQLSLYLESTPIFKEAAVHIIGNLGHWPWSTVQLKDLSTDLVSVLQRKIDDLKRGIADVERSLFMTSINVEGEEELLAPIKRPTINTWHVACLWKEWFTKSVARDEQVSKCMRRSDGVKYRMIAKGGEAYLTLETAMNHMKAFREPSRLTKADKQGIEEDLNMIKTFAQKQVQLLCANKSILSVEDESIEHLTCASVDDEDISWLKQDTSQVED